MVVEVNYDHLTKVHEKKGKRPFLSATQKVEVSRSTLFKNSVSVVTMNFRQQGGCELLGLRVGGH